MHPFYRFTLSFAAKLFSCLLSAALLLPPAALAQTTPDELVKSVANDVLTIVRKDQDQLKGDTSRMAKLIEEKIAPHFDVARMTRLAVGRSWHKATAEQQKQLVDEFRTLLVRSYSAVFTTDNQRIMVKVRPLQLQPGEDDVQVHTQIKLPDSAPPVNVDYSMYKASADWKVYDVTVDGVSLVNTYQPIFAEQVNRHGIEGLISRLSAFNSAKAPPKVPRELK
jgi:phospholipid transport system substrate-binding protein